MTRRKYTKAPEDVKWALENCQPVPDDFLPSPEEIRTALEREKKQKVTILLDSEAIGKFKEYAATHGLKYQSFINEVVAEYARKRLP